MSAAATSAPGASGVVVRVVEEGDMERLVRMLARLSPESAYRRFFTAMPKLTSGFLRSLVTVDDERGELVVAVERDEIVGLGSFHRAARAPAVAHVAVLVEDRWQHRGLGRELVARGSLASPARVGSNASTPMCWPRTDRPSG